MWQLPSESYGHSNCPGLTLLLWLVAVMFALHILGKMLVAFLFRYRKAVHSAVGECRLQGNPALLQLDIRYRN